MVVTDGQKLTLGDTTLTLYLTPGHTPGTISTLIPVKDNGRGHLVAEWGGTMFNFARSRDAFDTYIASAERFQGIVARAGADALISNHTIYDGTKTKIPALAQRKPARSASLRHRRGCGKAVPDGGERVRPRGAGGDDAVMENPAAPWDHSLRDELPDSS